MKKKLKQKIINNLGMCIIATIAFFAIGFYWYYTQVKKNDYSVISSPISNVNPLNGKYLIGGDYFVLSNGKAEKIGTDNKKIVVSMVGSLARGDLSGDTIIDNAFIVAYNYNDNVSYYVVAAIRSGDLYISSNAVFLGDNIFHESISIEGGNIIERYFENESDLKNSKNEKIVYLQFLNNELSQVIK